MLANINLKIGDEVGVNDDFLATVDGFKIDTDGTVLVSVEDLDGDVFDVKIGDLAKNAYEDYEPLIVESKVGAAIGDTDFMLLTKQKVSLLRILIDINAGKIDKGYFDDVQGIINFIDAIQDGVVEDGIRSEEEVFDLEKD